MPINGDEEEVAYIRELNEELSDSLTLPSDIEGCKSKLAANSNDPLRVAEVDTGSV